MSDGEKDAKWRWVFGINQYTTDILKCKIFQDYHDKYLLAVTDVILFAGCFHAFRKSIYKMHKSDPAYFLGLPGLSQSLAMKHIPEGKAIELLEKPEDYLAFQNSIQGEICQEHKDMPRGSMMKEEVKP